jgi:hypothetical protein
VSRRFLLPADRSRAITFALASFRCLKTAPCGYLFPRDRHVPSIFLFASSALGAAAIAADSPKPNSSSPTSQQSPSPRL